MKLSHAIVEKIKRAGSPDEVLAIARECNVDVTPDEAKTYYDQVSSHELDDDLLEGVAGGFLFDLDCGPGSQNAEFPKC